jgi:heme exporter protein C
LSALVYGFLSPSFGLDTNSLALFLGLLVGLAFITAAFDLPLRIYHGRTSKAGDLVTLFGLLVLLSGPIWSKASWGVYWKWDARLTTSLLLWMTFLAYSLVRRYGGLGSERLAAGMAVFGMANVPLIYFAVELWRTQHPQTSVVRSLAPGMRPPFYLAVFTFVFFYVVLLVARLAVGRGQRLLHQAQDRMAEQE